MIILNTNKLSQEALDCLSNAGETNDGLAYLGIAPSAITQTLKVFSEPLTIPQFLIVNPDLLTNERIELIDRLEDDLNQYGDDLAGHNDYYDYMKQISPYYLSDDDSFFDYGNSFVTTIAEEVVQCIS